ncbi:MAG: hypothetical protein GWO24_09645, partial [Akkermansiaceae bacterium]|nr:hypothetical protein [Akkermansiaceae bacterium]
VAAVNDETHGDASAWAGATADSFVGINLGADLVEVRSFAFGRDNTGAETTNWAGEYTVQITETPNPDQNTPDEEWLAIGIVIY